MDDTEKTDQEAQSPDEQSPLVGAAKVLGSAVGKVASIVGAAPEKAETSAPETTEKQQEPAPVRPRAASSRPKATAKAAANVPAKKPVKQKENLYQAEYQGSGTFKITKPKRTKAKRRQSALKNRRRGSRK